MDGHVQKPTVADPAERRRGAVGRREEEFEEGSDKEEDHLGEAKEGGRVVEGGGDRAGEEDR